LQDTVFQELKEKAIEAIAEVKVSGATVCFLWCCLWGELSTFCIMFMESTSPCLWCF